MEFDLSASSPVLEIQTSDFGLSRLRENETSKENGSAAHASEKNADLIDLSAESPNGTVAKSNTSGAVTPETAQANGHSTGRKSSVPVAKHPVSHVQHAAIREEHSKPTKSTVPAIPAERKVESSIASPRPFKRQKTLPPNTPETPTVRDQGPTVSSNTLASLLAAAPRKTPPKAEKVEAKVLEVPPHEYRGYIEGDTDDEDSGVVDGGRKVETKSALCQFKTRRKQGLAYKIYKHELYTRLNLLVLESRNWTEYIGVFDSAEQATSIGEALVRQIAGRVSNDSGASVSKDKVRSRRSGDPRQEAHERAKMRLRTTKLPMEVNSYFKLVATGTLVTSGPGYKNYHNANYVFPVGFKSIRNYFCCLDPANKVNYVNEVLRGEAGPLFKVTREGTNLSFEGASASAAWNKLCKRIAERKKELGMVVSQPGKHSRSGFTCMLN